MKMFRNIRLQFVYQNIIQRWKTIVEDINNNCIKKLI